MADTELRMLSDRRYLTITEVCALTNAQDTFVYELVQEGVIEATQDSQGDWLISERAVLRVTKAVSLREDLGVNLPGIAVALQLLEELRRL